MRNLFVALALRRNAVKLTSIDLALQRRSRTAQQRWERGLRADGARSWLGLASMSNRVTDAGSASAFRKFEVRVFLTSAGALVGAVPFALARALGRMLSGVPLPHFAAGTASYRVVVTSVGLLVTGAALAATAITKGYVDYPEKFWQDQITERIQSPIFGRDNTLIGSVGLLRSKFTPDQAREYSFIPVQGELPETYKRALLVMENKNLLKGGIHNICGLDIATLKRWVVNFGAGGSTLSMQLARELRRPDWGNEAFVLQKVWRKFLELGASCRLYSMLGNDSALMKMYASYAPTFQANGTTRGIEAASRIVFDVAPLGLTDAQQLILAAAARKPLTLLPPGATDINCKRVYPATDNPLFEPATAKANVARRVQCQILHRAIFRAPDVLDGERLASAIRDLRTYQQNGVIPVNPFEPIPAKRLVNLASRTASAMPKGLLEKIRQEADDGEIAMGEPLFVTFDAVQQHQFHEAMSGALDKIQRSPRLHKTLCLPLISVNGKAVNLPSCGKPQEEVQSADVLALNVDAVTGGLRGLYASSPLLMDSRQSIGSTAKLIIVTAALADGFTPSALFCPKAAVDGVRQLRRVAQPEYGFADCNAGRHLVTFERAIASSDNLVLYGLAQKLGARRLTAAATALALGEPTGSPNLAYELSFGTYGARPRELISAFQALVAVAYGLETSGHAPRALNNASDEKNPSIARLKKLLPSQTQRADLRQLLEAPVQSVGGTLSFLDGKVSAGKSGTVESFVKAPNGRNFNHGKWSVTYQADKNAINLFIIASPLPSVPLAQHDLGAKALMPAHLQILNLE